ncbi:glutathione hydrolase-like YwrD proenzyme isoform X2 [Ornithodoros turicata]
MTKPVPYISRRSPVLGLNGCVSTDQPLATTAALEILRKGGNAVDAAIAGVAVLQVIQPYATGIGGDCFCLFYDGSQKRVKCINGSGKSPSKLTLDLVNAMGYNESHPLDDATALSATVPGAAKGWYDSHRYFGSNKVSMEEILEPAIGYAEQGFPVGPMNSAQWEVYRSKLLNMHGGKTFLVNGSDTPPSGMVLQNLPLANVLKKLAREGPSAIYRGDVAQSIVDAAVGGVLSLEDLEDHLASNENPCVVPISTTYHGVTLHTTPPPSHGAIFLEALNILEGFDLKGYDPTSAEYLHLMTEALRLSFADGLSYVADPTSGAYTGVGKMMCKEYAAQRRALISLDRVAEIDVAVSAAEQSHTTFLATSDGEGNACAFINSNFKGFGCSIVERHGFALHCRGLGFNLIPGHPNCVGPRKRPYHTLMPVIATDSSTGKLMAAMGTMGGYGQPQQNLRVLLNMLEMKMNPQEAVDMPRIMIGSGVTVHPNDYLMLEEGLSDDVVDGLKKRGHKIERVLTGRERRDLGHYHVIARGNWWCTDVLPTGSEANVYWAGCDPRSDGVAAAF